MKAICTRKDLFHGVQVAGRAVSSRSSLPILGQLLIRSEGEKLRIAATDLEIGMECSVPANVSIEGSLTVPAKLIHEILAAMPDTDIEISSDETNQTTLKCGASEYSILGLPPEEFPMLPEVREEASFACPSSLLKNAIRNTRFAVSSDESRPRLTGILTTISGENIGLVSTDTHRLCLFNFKSSEYSGEAKVIIPGKAMAEVERILGDSLDFVHVAVGNNQVLFTVDETILVSRLIEGQFLDYERAIPKEFDRKLTIPTEQMLTGIKRASIVARESSNKTILKTTWDKIKITAESGGIGRAYEEVDLILEGEEIEIAFNASYLIDFLQALADDNVESFEMRLSGPLNAALMQPLSDDEDKSYSYVLMPMQL